MQRSLITWFILIIVVSVIPFLFAVIVMFIEPPGLFGPVAIDPVVETTVPPSNVSQQCLDMINRRHQKASRVFAPVMPPWIGLAENVGATVGNATQMQQLYVQVFAAHTRRLGNQLFNYASLFGVAWRNRGRMPLWPNRKTQLRNAFDLRIPIDSDNVISVRRMRLVVYFL
jgi:hypothetical protein